MYIIVGCVVDVGFSWLRRDMIRTACKYNYQPCIDRAQAEYNVYRHQPSVNRWLPAWLQNTVLYCLLITLQTVWYAYYCLMI